MIYIYIYIYIHREHTQSVRVTDRLLFCSECTGFPVRLTHSDISQSIYYKSMFNYRTCSKLSSFCLKNDCLSDFEGLWVRRLVFLIIEGQGRNPCFERAPSPEQFSPRKSHRSAFKLCSIKVERFTLLLVPSDGKSIPKVRRLALEEN